MNNPIISFYRGKTPSVLNKQKLKPNCKILLFLFLITAMPAKALIIVAKLKPKQKITFFYDDEKLVRLINDTNVDTTITKKVNIKTLTEFRYGILFTEKTFTKTLRHTMLLSPQDSLVFAKEGYEILPLNRKIESIFLERHVNSGFYYLSEQLNSNKIKDNVIDFKNYLLDKKSDFTSDSTKIIKLKNLGIINIKQSEDWVLLAKITYLTLIYNALSKSAHFNTFFSEKLLDEGKTMIKSYKIKGSAINMMISALCECWTKAKNLKSKNATYDFIDFYLENDIHKNYIQHFFINYIKNFNDQSSEIYKRNLERIKFYAKENDKVIFELLDNNIGFFPSPNQVELMGITGKSNFLTEVFNNSKTKYFIIDMWASWCKPCRLQIPAFKKFKKEFEKLDITFLSISIDERVEDWQKALKEEELNQDLNHYRLLNYAKSPLTKYFDVVSVPRYILMTADGKILANRFYLPTDIEFKPELLKLLSN